MSRAASCACIVGLLVLAGCATTTDGPFARDGTVVVVVENETPLAGNVSLRTPAAGYMLGEVPPRTRSEFRIERHDIGHGPVELTLVPVVGSDRGQSSGAFRLESMASRVRWTVAANESRSSVRVN